MTKHNPAFFNKPDLAASITGVNGCLIQRISTIFQTLSCGYNINETVFKEYALQSARNLIQQNTRYNMPMPVHIILDHGAALISAAVLHTCLMSDNNSSSYNEGHHLWDISCVFLYEMQVKWHMTNVCSIGGRLTNLSHVILLVGLDFVLSKRWWFVICLQLLFS